MRMEIKHVADGVECAIYVGEEPTGKCRLCRRS